MRPAAQETLRHVQRLRPVEHVRRDWQRYLLLAPAVILLGIFHYVPIYGIVVAFQDFNAFDGVFGSPFVGLKHFLRFFDNPYFPRLVRNTFLLSLLTIVFGFPAPVILALLLHEVPDVRYRRVVQSLSYLPHFISTVVIVGIVWRVFSSEGVVSHLLQALGLPAFNFLVDSRWFRPIYVMSGIWTEAGWASIVYLAALTGVDEEIYEASIIDGANRMQRTLHVNFPALLPTVTLMLILSVSGLMAVGFEKVYLMQNPATYEVSDVIATYVYREGIVSANYSYGAAVGLLNSVVALALLATANAIARRVSETSLW